MAETIYPYNFTDIFVYLQSYAIFRWLFENFGDFVENNTRQIYFRAAQKRFAPHLEYPSLVLVWDGLDPEEDVGVWSYLPQRVFFGNNNITVSYDDWLSMCNLNEKEYEAGTQSLAVSSVLQFPNLPVPQEFYKVFTGPPDVKYAWATNQYISSKWRLEYISKVVDPFKEGYSTTRFLSRLKGYFPFQKYFQIPIKEVAVPMIGDKTKAMKLTFETDNYFIVRFLSAVDSESVYEAGEDDRSLQVTISAETRGHVLSFWKGS